MRKTQYYIDAYAYYLHLCTCDCADCVSGIVELFMIYCGITWQIINPDAQEFDFHQLNAKNINYKKTDGKQRKRRHTRTRVNVCDAWAQGCVLCVVQCAYCISIFAIVNYCAGDHRDSCQSASLFIYLSLIICRFYYLLTRRPWRAEAIQIVCARCMRWPERVVRYAHTWNWNERDAPNQYKSNYKKRLCLWDIRCMCRSTHMR